MSLDALAPNVRWWLITAFLVFVDSVFLVLLVNRLPKDRLLGQRRLFFFNAFLIWLLLFGATFWGDAWDTSYRLVLPEYSRYLLPFVLAALTVVVAILVLPISLHLPGPPVIWVSLLGAVALVPLDLWQLSGLGLIRIAPSLAGVSLTVALVSSFTESILIWCAILALTPLLRYCLGKLLNRLIR